MSKDKISAQDIIDSLAAKADITKLLADDFFKAFIAAIEEALLANDSVKVKNLGIFKLNWVAPRRSVDVQTGEDIVLSGYYKTVFTPDKDLRELVNKPFAYLESVVLDEEKPKEEPAEELNSISSLTEQADEIKGLLSEIQSMSVEEKVEVENDKEKIKEIETTEENTKNLVVETNSNEPVEIIQKEEIIRTTMVEETYYIEPKRKKRTWLWILLTILLFLIIFVVLYFSCMSVQHWVNKNVLGHDTAVYDDVADESSKFAEEPLEEAETTPPAADDFQKAFDARFDKREIMAKVEMGNGNRLAYLAQRHYGSPYFWVYIYEVNTNISDPDIVPIGTIVDVPKMDPLLVDPKNPRSIELALDLAKKYKHQ